MRWICLLATIWTVAGTRDEAWEELAHNRVLPARALFEHAMSTDADPTLARIGWFLTFTGNGPTDELAQAANQILKWDAHDPACEFVMAWMKPLRDHQPQWARDAAQFMTDVAPANPELRIHYSNHMRHIASLDGDRALFDQALRMSSYLTQWRFAPRYGHNPIPDFARAWPPEQADNWPDDEVRHFRRGVVVPDGSASGTGVVYAFSEFDLAQSGPIVFRLFSYQTIQVYLDGRRLIDIPHLELERGRINAVRAELASGHHEVMVKITQTRGQNGQFSLNLEGRGISFPEPGLPSLDINGEAWQAQPITYGLRAKVAEDESALGRFVSAFLLAGERDIEPSLTLLTHLYEAYPSSQLIGGSMAEILLGGVRFIPEDQRLGRAYQTLLELSTRDDRTAENVYRLGRLLLDARYIEESIPHLESALSMNPEFCEAIETLLEVSLRQGQVDLREKALKLAEGLGDDHVWGLKLRYANAISEENLVEVRGLLERLAHLEPWEGFRAELLEMNEDYLGAIENLKYRLDLFPEKDDFLFDIASHHAKLGDRNAQREWLERTLERSPANRRALLDLINLDCYEGHTETARRRIVDYLELEPADGDFRQMLSHLDGRTAFESFRVNTSDVIKAATNTPMSKNADSELLLDQLMVRLFADGSQMRYTHLVTRVLTKDGVDQESELNLPDDLEILELRTIKQDGTVFYPEDIENKSTISLSGIGVGDFIDEEHIEYLPPAYYDPDGIDASMSFVFQGIDRIYHHSELVLIYPSDLNPKPEILSRNFPNPVEIQEDDDGLTYVRWLTQEMPPVAAEPAMPNPAYFLPRATLYYNTEWNEIRDFFLNAVRLRMVMTDQLSEQLNQWRDGVTQPRDLAQKIYRQVVDEIEPSGQFYQNINLAWATRTGNAALLLAKLYEEANIPCQLVLARQRETLQTGFDVPMPDLFTYALLRIEVDGEAIWLDPNRKGLPFGYIPFEFRGSNGLVLDTDSESPLLEIPEFDHLSERIEFVYNFTFDEDGAAHAVGTEYFHGALAADLKENFESLNQLEIEQRVEVGVNANFPGAKVTDARVLSDSSIGEFALESTFDHHDLVRLSKSWQIDQLLPPNSIQSKYASQPSRHLPVHIRRPHINQGRLTLSLPDTMVWATKARQVTRESPFGLFSLTVEPLDDRTVEITRRYELPSQIIAVADYQSFLEFCQFMTENEEIQLEAIAREP